MVCTVSINGIDDSVNIEDIVDLSVKYPFIEWNINLKSLTQRETAYPSSDWLDTLINNSDKLRVCGHLHGRWRRDIIERGDLSLRLEHPALWAVLHRIQLDTPPSPKILDILNLTRKKIIVDSDDKNDYMVLAEKKKLPLFPLSKEYSTINNNYGYIVDSNDVYDFLKAIEYKEHDKVWLSLDNFRDSNEITFDLEKVESCLDIIEDYVTAERWIQALFETTCGKDKISYIPNKVS